MTRKPVIFGNWKMNLRSRSIDDLLNGITSMMEDENPNVDAGVFPPFVYLPRALERTGETPVIAGAQNCHNEKNGSYTGEVSPWMIKDIGADWVIIGHSERRHDFGEDDAFLRKKVAASLEAGLNVVFCIGETESQRDDGRTRDVLTDQLSDGLSDTGIFSSNREVIVAYEPVWAIGTGRSAEPEQAQEAFEWIRSWIGEETDPDTAEQVRTQYGGSVKPHNAESILSQPDIDGALIGGASLESESFNEIIRCAKRTQ